MSEPVQSTQPLPESVPPYDRATAHVREYVAAGLALVIVIGAVAMMIMAITRVGAAADDVAFQRIKDLLLFINPLLGVVLGYYFNKASTEARAESAEYSATTAASLAKQAATSRDRAQASATAAQVAVTEHKLALNEVTVLSQQLLDSTGADPSILSGPDEAGDVPIRRDLQQALEHARRVMRTTVMLR